MPRKTNAASDKHAKQQSIWPAGLKFIASLLFLYVIFGGTAASTGWWSPYILSGGGSIWLPVMYGLAVLSSIGLFFGSLSSLVLKTNFGVGWKTASIAAFALTVLTATPSFSGVFWVVVVGFIIGWVASAMEMM